jgi:hypothetical protein
MGWWEKPTFRRNQKKIIVKEWVFRLKPSAVPPFANVHSLDFAKELRGSIA